MASPESPQSRVPESPSNALAREATKLVATLQPVAVTTTGTGTRRSAARTLQPKKTEESPETFSFESYLQHIIDGNYDAAFSILESEIPKKRARISRDTLATCISLLIPHGFQQVTNGFNRLSGLVTSSGDRIPQNTRQLLLAQASALTGRSEVATASLGEIPEGKRKELIAAHPVAMGLVLHGLEYFPQAIHILEQALPEMAAATEREKNPLRKTALALRLATVCNILAHSSFEVGVEKGKIAPYLQMSRRIYEKLDCHVGVLKIDNNDAFLRIHDTHRNRLESDETRPDEESKATLKTTYEEITANLQAVLQSYENPHNGEKKSSQARTILNLAIATVYLGPLCLEETDMRHKLEEALKQVHFVQRLLGESQSSSMYLESLNLHTLLLHLLGKTPDAIDINRQFSEITTQLQTLGRDIPWQVHVANALRQLIDPPPEPCQISQKKPDELYAVKMNTLFHYLLREDPFTLQHSERVGTLAKNFSDFLRKQKPIPEHFQELLLFPAGLWETAGRGHDCGKGACGLKRVYDSRKKGNMTPEESAAFEAEMAAHTGRGFSLVARLAPFLPKHPFLPHIIHAIHGHHERIDRQGYPKKLGGKEIPLIAQIISILDYIDANLSARTYKDGRELQEVLADVQGKKGIYFDEEIVDLVMQFFQKSSAEIMQMYESIQTTHDVPTTGGIRALGIMIDYQKDLALHNTVNWMI